VTYNYNYVLTVSLEFRVSLLCEDFDVFCHKYFRWYYTSDAEVRETTLQEVMQASAYMLFYTKYTSPLSQQSIC